MGNSGSRLRFWRRHRKSPCPQSNGHSDNPRPQVPDPYAHDQGGSPFPNDGQGPHGSVSLPAIPFVELQKAVVIRNDVNIKKESLCVEPDEDNPGKFLVSFVLDASAAGSFSIIFFAKEGPDSQVTAMKETLLEPVSISFQEGLGQKFRQPSGTGIDFSMLNEIELTGDADEVYPLAVRAEAYPSGSVIGRSEVIDIRNRKAQITFAMFEKKDLGIYQVCSKKQIFWVGSYRYELQDIFGIGSSAEGNETAKECIICLCKSRNTIVLPCRHLCLCSNCAKILSFKSSQCPICRKPVERFLEIDISI